MSEELLTLDEACKLLHCGRSFLFKLRKHGLIQTVEIGKRYKMVPRSSIDGLVDRLKRWDSKIAGGKK